MRDGAINHAAARSIAIIGGGPAGLMAAETLCAAGFEVHVYDRMQSVGRKFLVAGKGGLNLTHSDVFDAFVARYGARAPEVANWLREFDADALRVWARSLGVETFIGSSGRVFPLDLKAAPLLRGWLRRLRAAGVRFHVQHQWLGWDATGALLFSHAGAQFHVSAAATVLALGGGSWPVLGSDGAWVPILNAQHIDLAPLRPSNCGFDVAPSKFASHMQTYSAHSGNGASANMDAHKQVRVAEPDLHAAAFDVGDAQPLSGWSEHFATRFAGAPVRPVVVHCHASSANAQDQYMQRQGEFVITTSGIEGSLVYALSSALRDTIAAHGSAEIMLDLAPGRSLDRLRDALARPRGGRSLSEHLRRQTGLEGVKVGLLFELAPKSALQDATSAASLMKALPLRLLRPRPLAESISSAGGVRFTALDANGMLRGLPGVFCAGEMIDWEAPTGGYLLTACFASGRAAAIGAARWLRENA